MFKRPLADAIASNCYMIDSYCRKELSERLINSERDYVSILMSRIRDFLPPAFNIHVSNFTLNASDEKKFGCDAAIIFYYQNMVKVGLFEAKWPRAFISDNYPWDRIIYNKSHFSSQIERQLNWHNSGAVIWEMFFNENSPGNLMKPFDKDASSCLLFRDADEFMHKVKKGPSSIWVNNDLTLSLLKGVNLKYIIRNILSCRLGKKLSIKDFAVNLEGLDNKIISLPIILPKTQIASFISDRLKIISELGFSHYTVLDLSESKYIVNEESSSY